MPQQRGEQKRRGDALAGADALVGLLQRQVHEALAQGLLKDHVEHRQHAMMQAFDPEAVNAGERMAGHQDLGHLVEQPGRGTFSSRGASSRIGRARARIDRETVLAASLTARSILTGSSR